MCQVPIILCTVNSSMGSSIGTVRPVLLFLLCTDGSKDEYETIDQIFFFPRLSLKPPVCRTDIATMLLISWCHRSLNWHDYSLSVVHKVIINYSCFWVTSTNNTGVGCKFVGIYSIWSWWYYLAFLMYWEVKHTFMCQDVLKTYSNTSKAVQSLNWLWQGFHFLSLFSLFYLF